MVSATDRVNGRVRCVGIVLWRVCLVVVLGSGASVRAGDGVDPAGAEFFEKKIRPVFEEVCFKCHSEKAEKLKGGLRLDTAEGLRKGGETGPAIVPGKPEESRLIRAIRYLDSDLQMPPKKRLPAEVVADFEKWVEMGAPDPRGDVSTAKPQAAEAAGIDYEKGREFWSFKPVSDPRPPRVKNAKWVKSPVDRFILSKLEQGGLKPAAPADKRTLLRRATFDLTGLPPTPGEVADFLADESPGAFAKVVERLLASPAYGQRWGRHWLDVVRYADSFDKRFNGMVSDITQAWRYRDWVVDAVNRDQPYDKFIADQIAGDILLEKGGTTDQLIATTVLAIGEWGTGDSDKRKVMTDIVDDQIDLIGRGVLGLTLACARCHDHKFDPIATKDYYAMAGFFFSSHILPEPGNPGAACSVLNIPVLVPAERDRRRGLEEESSKLKSQVEEIRANGLALLGEEVRGKTADYLDAVREIHAARGAGGTPNTESIAGSRGLRGVVLQRWLGYLGLPDGSEPYVSGLLTKRVNGLVGEKEIVGWGDAATPFMVVNPTDQPRQILTFKVPARGVALHPAPDRPVAVGWRSPIAGRVSVTGKVADADPNCGNGVIWIVELRRAGERQVLATGTLDSGASGAIAGFDSVEVAIGDVVSLVIDPRNNDHSCDTTAVEFKIAQAGVAGGSTWDLAADLLPDVHAGNPHSDSYGHAGVWHIYALNGSQPTHTIAADSPVGRWAAALRSGATPEALAPLAEAARAAIVADKPPEFTAKDGLFLRGMDATASLSPDQRQRLQDANTRMGVIGVELARPVAMANAILEGGVPKSEHEGFRDAKVHIRGRYDRLADVAPRGYPRVLTDATPTIAEGESGRLELARWLPSIPLTSRVMVNRVWQHHFGRGIVPTPDNFGKLGTPPTHPELLDWLALRFVESGWSLKAMHRLVMLSAAYQQSSIGDPKTAEKDPENNLLGRMSRRRLEVEPLRDAMLAAAGGLDTTHGGPSIADPMTPRRTLYVTTVRSDNANFRGLFDGADPSAIVVQRNESTVAPQSLYMLNNPFVLAQTKAIAQRVLASPAIEAHPRVMSLYEWLYAREPTARELEVGLTFVGGDNSVETWQAYCQVLICANEFMYVD